MIFTLEQINNIHDRLGNKETHTAYVATLNTMGVKKYDTYISDGHSEFFDKEGRKVASPPVHEILSVCDESDGKQARKQLDLHNQGKINYLEMSKGLAESGVEKWTVDTSKMTFACYDKQGNELLIESIS